MTAEVWKAVEGYPAYHVSDHGRVVSYRRRAPRVLRPAITWDGYPQVTLSNSEGRANVRVHRLVIAAFIGVMTEGSVTRHLDGDSTNNRVENLAIGTQLENMRDRLRHGRNPQANKTHCKRGHAFSPENTYVHVGSRYCRTCRRLREREARERQMLRAAGIAA